MNISLDILIDGQSLYFAVIQICILQLIKIFSLFVQDFKPQSLGFRIKKEKTIKYH